MTSEAEPEPRGGLVWCLPGELAFDAGVVC